MKHEIKPVPWVPHNYGKPASNHAPLGVRQTPHGCMTWISVTALVVGLITAGIWHDDEYCHRNPDAGPGMRVDRPCYEVLAESSAWKAVMGDIGWWLIAGSVIGFLVALWWYFRHHLHER
ncbi:hypothetical protein OG763_14445 [Streptomyces sp. NBC_01230]|uniref:hypothetical protein n=1 Tax=Streptomyces sp. NBC_01230 TaxID=2903784 RepID=UPI002E0D8702|nr:hypothetical protein OG763_14445 [Streptomyces sp. NBC_01230]